MQIEYMDVTTIVGPVRIEAVADAITGVHYIERIDVRADKVEAKTPILQQAAKELQEYFAGKRKTFTLPIKFLTGTEFQQAVWAALQTIPYGTTCSYADIAEKVGSPKAVRAVGGANNKNPISIIVPCHRVIGKDGALVGYGGGLANKVRLLALEQGE